MRIKSKKLFKSAVGLIFGFAVFIGSSCDADGPAPKSTDTLLLPSTGQDYSRNALAPAKPTRSILDINTLIEENIIPDSFVKADGSVEIVGIIPEVDRDYAYLKTYEAYSGSLRISLADIDYDRHAPDALINKRLKITGNLEPGSIRRVNSRIYHVDFNTEVSRLELMADYIFVENRYENDYLNFEEMTEGNTIEISASEYRMPPPRTEIEWLCEDVDEVEETVIGAAVYVKLKNGPILGEGIAIIGKDGDYLTLMIPILGCVREYPSEVMFIEIRDAWDQIVVTFEFPNEAYEGNILRGTISEIDVENRIVKVDPEMDDE